MQTTLPVPLSGRREKDLLHTVPGQVMVAVAASAFVGLCAHISFPLWFTPVPLTLANFAVLLIGLALGPVAGFSAMLLYLAEGAAGIPVFSVSPQGLSGVAQLLGPTGGFLMSYPLAAAIAGSLRGRITRSPFASAVVACLAATIAIFTFGAGWLDHTAHLSLATAFWMGVAPFLPGEVVKIASAAGIYTSLRRWHLR